MPIYAYKCESCGHSLEVLQKMSDAPLTQCPACGTHALAKQVTAAGFQLKGSGWYVTDFRGGATSAPAADAKATEAKATDAKTPDAGAPAAAATAAAATPAATSVSTPAAAAASSGSKAATPT